MSDEVQELRDQGRLLEAARRLQAAIEAGSPRGRKLWQMHVLGRECLLLEAAQQYRDAAETLDVLKGLVGAAKGLQSPHGGRVAVMPLAVDAHECEVEFAACGCCPQDHGVGTGGPTPGSPPAA